MTCTFFGHKNAPYSIKSFLEQEIILLIKKGVDTFLVGNNGNFDLMVQGVVEKIALSNKSIKYSIVLSRIDESAISGNQSATIFPEGFERYPKRFAISKRNDWLISNSSYAIVYVQDKYSNSYKWAQKAIKKNLKTINLFDKNKADTK